MGAVDLATLAVRKLEKNIQAAMEARGKNATGGTSKRLLTIPSGDDTTGQASLEADSQWKWVGNGRGPGRMPPIGSIRAWIAARGLDLNAYAVARKIANLGSRDFRLKRTNVFLDEIREWEKTDLPETEAAYAQQGIERGLDAISDIEFN